MKKSSAVRSLAAVAASATATLAQAAGDSGTGSMGEMQLSGVHFAMMVGGLVALGVVVWLVAKFAGK
jgi:hypothetical protein